MRNVGMKYQYSYEEQWQPKDLLVTFRMYQLNLDGNLERVYKNIGTHLLYILWKWIYKINLYGPFMVH